MKKIKMIANAIVVLSVVGGALAFTPMKLQAYCIDGPDTDAVCDDFFEGTQNPEAAPINYKINLTPASEAQCAGQVCDGTIRLDEQVN